MARKTFRKVITSDELVEQINPKNKRLINAFLKHKNAKCSDKTIINYKSDLNIYFCYNLVNNDNKFFIDVKKLELAEFFDYCIIELQWSGNRYSRMRSLLNSFSKFIEDYLDDNYPDFRNIVDKAVTKIPKEPVRKKTILLEEQVYLLRNRLIEEDKVDQAMYLMLLASSGARVSETFCIKNSLIDENNTAFGDIFLETTEEIKTKGHGKKGTMMTRFLVKDVFMPTYKLWLPIREKRLKDNNKESDALIVDKNGDDLTPSKVQNFLRYWETILNVNLYCHCYRHFLVSDLTRKNCSSDFIIAVMKWKSADMFKIYNDIQDKDRNWKEIDKLKNAFQSDIK